jgi:hypothetical protein
VNFLRSGLTFLGVILVVLLILAIYSLSGNGHPSLISIFPVLLIRPTFIGKMFAFFGPDTLFGEQALEYWFLIPLACAALVEYFIVGGAIGWIISAIKLRSWRLAAGSSFIFAVYILLWSGVVETAPAIAEYAISSPNLNYRTSLIERLGVSGNHSALPIIVSELEKLQITEGGDTAPMLYSYSDIIIKSIYQIEGIPFWIEYIDTPNGRTIDPKIWPRVLSPIDMEGPASNMQSLSVGFDFKGDVRTLSPDIELLTRKIAMLLSDKVNKDRSLAHLLNYLLQWKPWLCQVPENESIATFCRDLGSRSTK